MKTLKYNLRNLVLVSVAALFLAITFTTRGTFGQTGTTAQCPVPRHVTLTASTPSANMADFPANCSTGYEQNLGGTTPNKCYIHTFDLPISSDLCCQCIDSKKNFLTIRYKALQGGPVNSASSWNDTVAIYPGALSAAKLYPQGSAVATGQTGTKTIPITCAMLAHNRLSFLVQDDTAVTSATLDLDLCCVKK
jgi:hypothetical protein